MSQPLPFDVIPEPIPRDRWKRPLIVPADGGDPIPYTRASTYGGVLEDETGLTKWKQRQTLVGATIAPQVLISAAAHREDRDKLNELVETAMQAAQANARAEIGTALHKLFETIDQGRDPGAYPTEYAADVEAYQKVTEGWDFVAAETFVVCDDLRAAGTFDRLRRLPNGKLRIADVKTGDSLYPLKMAVQLAIYAHGIPYTVAGGRKPLGEMDTETADVIHVPAGQGLAQIVEVPLREAWEAAQLSAKVHAMRKDAKTWLKTVASTSTARLVSDGDLVSALIAQAGTPDETRAVWAQHAATWTAEHTELAKARIAVLEGAAA